MSVGNSLLAGVLRATDDAVFAFEAVRDAHGGLFDFRCTVANACAARLFPRPGGWEGCLLLHDQAPWGGPDLWPRLAALASGGDAVRIVLAVDGPGATRWVDVAAEAIDGGFVAVVKDVTERRRTEQERGAGDRTIDEILDAISYPIFVKDRESRYVRVNRAMTELWRVPAERILGRQVIALEDRPSGEAELALETDRIVLNGQESLDRILTQTLPDGRARWMRIRKHPLLAAPGEIVGLVGIAEDLTELLAADRALRESEQRFRDLVEGSLQGITVLQDGRLVFGNTAFLRMFGFVDLAHAQHTPIGEVVAAHERERLLDNLRSRAAGENVPSEYEMECVRADGTHFWAYFLSRIVEWNGRPATQTALVDISRRKRAEQELETSRRLLRSVIETAPHGIFVKDLQGRFMLVNRAEADYHGLVPEDFVGRTAQELPWPDERTMAEILRAEREVIASGQPGGFGEIETVDARGLRSVRQLIQLPLHGDRGLLEGTVGLSLDITAAVAARREVHQAHAQLAEAIESFPGGIVLYDDQELLYLWNSRVAEMWPALADVLVAGTSYERFTRAALEREEGLTGEALEARMGELMAAFKMNARSRQFRAADGRWFRFFANRMSSGGTVVVMIDITEARRLEEDQRQSQKMEAIGQLTGGVAHDFNNLLTVILGNADLLMETLRDQPQAVACARMIAQAVQQGSALTQRLLAFARRQSLQPVALDLNRVVSGMGELIRRTLGENIEIELIRGGGLWKTQADPSQFEAALLNLAVNARDAMPDGGRLTVETGNAWLDDAYATSHSDVRPGQYVMLSVTDTGSGMSREVAARAFDPFFTTKEPGRGTGLGLSMVYGFVKQSGGHVKIYSELGQGTSVKIYLPRYMGPPQETEVPAEAEMALPRGAETVLVVEDEELVRVNAVRQLESLGYQVMSVPDARAALELLERLERVHLLFTDVVMPGGMNGLQLAQAAQRIWPKLKVLFASGYTPNAILHQGRLDPGIHLLSKPYGKSELARKVRRVLDE